MSVFKVIIATTYDDKTLHRLNKTEIEQLVKAYDEQYVRMTDEHDPRKLPIGRVIGCKLIQLSDGEMAAEAIFELYDGENPVEDDDNKFIVFESTSKNENITISFDESYLVDGKFEKVKELNKQIMNHNDLSFSIKNSIDPLSVLIIAGSFILGKIFEGFLHKIGEETYEIFKKKLFETLEAQKDRSEHVLQFALNIKKDKEEYRANVFITNPQKEDIDIVLKYGFKKLDFELEKYLAPPIKEINIEFKNRQFEVTYFLNGKAKILIPKEEFRIIDITV
jgi:hypothetical protein